MMYHGVTILVLLSTKQTTPMRGGDPGRSSLVWLWWAERTHRGGSVPRVLTERSEVPLVTLNLCVMRRYNLGVGDLVSTLLLLLC